MSNTREIWILLSLCAFACGCVDGPLYHLKRANPYFTSQWKKDREYGPTFEDRLKELELLQSQLASMSVVDQQLWVARLSKLIQEDQSAEIRTQAVKAIAQLPHNGVNTALNFAAGDKVEKVRMAACRAWKIRADLEAKNMLLSLAEADESSSVRQAAIDGLSAFPNDQEVRNLLAKLLSDRSPAVQYQVAQSLQLITGRNYGGDFESWKKFMEGEDLPEPAPPNVAQQIWGALPSW